MSSIPRAITFGLLALGISTIYKPTSRAFRVVGVFRNVENSIHASGDFVAIPDTMQCEDVHYHLPSNELFAACEDNTVKRFSWFPPLANFKDPSSVGTGSIHVINPETFKSRRLKYENFKKSLSTHGIDIISEPGVPGSVYLFLVNHPPHPDCTPKGCPSNGPKEDAAVEIFQHNIGSETARHIATIRHPLIRTPNDIYATSPRSFYVTNDHHYAEGFLRLIEDGFEIAKWTNTIWVEVIKPSSHPPVVEAKVALDNMHNNNGLGHAYLHTGEDTGEVLIGDAAGAVVHRAKRLENHNLTVIESIPLDSTIDNPSYFSDPYAKSTGQDTSGYVVAGLTKGILIDHHKTDPLAKDGAVVRHIKKKGDRWVDKILFEDDGSRIRSASAGVIVPIDPKKESGKRKGWLFVTGFFSEGMIAVKVDLDW